MTNAAAMLKLHIKKILAILLLANFQLIANLAVGDLKLWAEINWLDIVGEGGVMLFCLAWAIIILCSRPAGRVTTYLAAGLACLFIAGWQDFLDETIRLPDTLILLNWIESSLMPTGMVLLTVGLYHWHKEQLAVNEQLKKRERLFREHRSIDSLTCLSSADYLRQQLTFELEAARKNYQPLSLLMLDIDHFDDFNRRYGSQQGDRALQEVSEILLLNLRRCDLLCRYAGDRFAVLLPGTGDHLAQLISRQLIQAVQHFAFKTLEGETVYHSISAGVVVAGAEGCDSLIKRANTQLLHAKEIRDSGLRVA